MYPLNSLERLTSVWVMITGQMILAKVFADLNWITSTANFQSSQHIEKMAQIRGALKSMGMQPQVVQRVLKYTDYVNTLHKQRQLQVGGVLTVAPLRGLVPPAGRLVGLCHKQLWEAL